MDFVALMSGGKDSIYSILEACRQGHRLVACVHMGRPHGTATDPNEEEEEEESYMYQTAASEAVQVLVEDCLQVPLIHYPRRGRSVQTRLQYYKNTSAENDEVEDLYQALKLAVQRFPHIQAVSSGAILSTYQRLRIEHVACQRLQLHSLAYLWRRAPQRALLHQMVVDDQVEAILVRVAAPPGLTPRMHLRQQSLAQLKPHLLQLHEQYQLHVCGEGGEYESLVVDCPLYHQRLVLDEVKIVTLEDDGTGELVIEQCHAEPKPEGATLLTRPATNSKAAAPAQGVSDSPPTPEVADSTRRAPLPDCTRTNGGLWHTAELISPASVNGLPLEQQAVYELIQVLHLLRRTLNQLGCTAQDVVLVHLYLAHMSHFALLNRHYREFFGVESPPSRSCVALGSAGMPQGRLVVMDCLVQGGSGLYLRTDPAVDNESLPPAVQAALANPTAPLREVLHVQSRSHWAPICVGPYSQANSLRRSVHFMAGQIGLVPATMTFGENQEDWKGQLRQAWKNLARVLDALDTTTLQEIVLGLVYVSSGVVALNDALVQEELMSLCREQLESNGTVVAGEIDGTAAVASEDRFGGYEDEETMLEDTKNDPHTNAHSLEKEPPRLAPLLFVSIPEMPVGALAEVEVVTLTSSFAAGVDMKDSSSLSSATQLSSRPTKNHPTWDWDTGHNLYGDVPSTRSQVRMEQVCRSTKGISTTTIVASMTEMNCPARQLTRQVWSGIPDRERLLNVRIYYPVAFWDALQIRTAWYAAMPPENPPACTFVPVQDVFLCHWQSTQPTKDTDGIASDKPTPILAIQAMSIDAVQMETSRWLRHGR